MKPLARLHRWAWGITERKRMRDRLKALTERKRQHEADLVEMAHMPLDIRIRMVEQIDCLQDQIDGLRRQLER